MSFDLIDNAFVRQFDSALQHAAQQTESRLTKTIVDKGTIEGDSFTHNGLGTIEMDEKLVRLAATVLSPADHSTRVAVMRDFFKAVPLDRADVPKMKINPVTGGDYIRMLVAARNRRIDEIIWNAMAADQLMKDGATTALPAGQKILHSGQGLTKAKLIQAKKLFRKNESDEHNGEKLFIGYDAEMLEDFLLDPTLTSIEHASVKALQEGDVNRTFMGFNWIPYEFKTRAGNVATTRVWTTNSVKLGRAYEEGDVDKRPDLQNAWQTTASGSYGALRTQENLVATLEFQF
ncbi:MAG: hypothetical protein IT480_10735 [Gammaproteobacteria bacterium]|nr:hypothetical protein [Gammaproteobacteria bacterium]